MQKKKVPSMVKDEQLIQIRREQLIKGAVKLFKEKGFHRTTTREMAKEAGFSIGTLYEYIGSKEDVLYLVCDSIYEEVRTRLDAHLAKQEAGMDRLKQVIASLFKVMNEMQDEVLIMYQEAKSLPKESLSYVLKKEAEMTGLVESAVREASEAGSISPLEPMEIEILANNIMVAGQMWTFRRWTVQRTCTLEEYTAVQSRLLLSSLASETK